MRSSRCRLKAGRLLHYALGSDVGLLHDLSAGRVPRGVGAVGDDHNGRSRLPRRSIRSARRGRAKVLFGFDYVWEVYKPEHQRKYGYYTLPVLWGDQLVARFDSRLDRPTNTLVILGLWLEDAALGRMRPLPRPWARGFPRFVTFLGAGRLDADAIRRVAAAPAAQILGWLNRKIWSCRMIASLNNSLPTRLPIMLPRETPRLLLRPFQDSDLETFVAYRSDPGVPRYQGWGSALQHRKRAGIY